jgi:hypothetical protein
MIHLLTENCQIKLARKNVLAEQITERSEESTDHSENRIESVFQKTSIISRYLTD